MIILISPTKIFTKNKIKSNNLPHFIDKSKKLVDTIDKFSVEELEQHFKISNNLAKTTSSYYANLSNDNAAIYSYGGTAFKYLDPTNITDVSNIYILSGLYGILNALDGISPYRLDITNTTITNLYEYWKNDVNEYLANKSSLIINLASNEYSKHLDFENLNIITIDFIESNNGKYSNGSMMLKKMRGLMANYLSNNNINNLNIIKQIEIDDFIYSNDLSNKNKLIFLKGNII